MSPRRSSKLRNHPVVVDIGCRCRSSKLSSLFSFSQAKPTTPKPRHHSSPTLCDSSSTFTSSTTSATTSSWSPSQPSLTAKRPERKQKGAVEESEALVKHSTDPFLDFRDSMVQMIVEKDIYAWDELRRLLHRFLVLNSPHHHHLILQAFADICSGILSPPPSTPGAVDGDSPVGL